MTRAGFYDLGSVFLAGCQKNDVTRRSRIPSPARAPRGTGDLPESIIIRRDGNALGRARSREPGRSPRARHLDRVALLFVRHENRERTARLRSSEAWLFNRA